MIDEVQNEESNKCSIRLTSLQPISCTYTLTSSHPHLISSIWPLFIKYFHQNLVRLSYLTHTSYIFNPL
jgi:hypothetical protein